MTWYDYGSIDLIDDVSTATGKTISTLTLFNGKLFMGYGDYGANQPPNCHLLGWDIATGVVVDYGSLNTVAVLDMNVVNGQLAVPYTDASVGSYPNAAFLDTSGNLSVVGNDLLAWHVYGSASFGGKRYISGAWADPNPPNNNAYGIWRDDGPGVGWMRWSGGNPTFEPNSYLGTQRSTTILYRVHGLFVLGSTLYAGFGNGTILKTTTGALGSWTTAAGGVGRMKRPVVIGSEAFYGNNDPPFAGQLYKHTGTAQTQLVSVIYDHTLGTDGNLYYLDTSMNIKNLAGTTVETAPANSRCIAYVNGVWYAGTTASHLWATTPMPSQNRVLAGSNVVKDSSGNQVIHT